MSEVLEKIVVLKLNDKKDEFTTVPKSMQHEVSRKIGSEFAPKSRDTIRGLSISQERVFLPSILGVQPGDPNFPAKCREFWADFILSPDASGIRLNIATTIGTTKVKKYDNHTGEEKEVEEPIEVPVNIDDYMAYKFAMASSRVAKTPDDMQNIAFFDFYLVDLETEKEKQNSEFEALDKADNIYVRLTIDSKWTENENKINHIIELLRDRRMSINITTMTKIEKKMMLSKFKNEIPLKFVSTVENPNLEYEAFLSQCVENRVLVKEGNDYYNNDEAIGSSNVVIAWLKNPVNSGKVQAIKSRLEDTIKQKRS